MRALEAGAAAPGGEGPGVRRVLVRRVYLNPKSFAPFRPYFTAAGFEVVDCPPLTARGKTGADIHMVLDAMDLVGGAPGVDELVVMSADTDFAPLLLRLRRLDVRTLVLATGQCSPAYRNAADRLLEGDALVELLKGRADGVDGAGGAVGAGPDAPLAREAAPDPERLAAVAAFTLEIVRRAAAPVDLASLAHRLRDRFPGIGGDWLGFERLSSLVNRLELEELERSALPPGYLWDPARHERPVAAHAAADREAWLEDDPELGELVRRVARLTEVPILEPERLDTVYDAIADCVAETGETHITNLSRRVRDLCAERGATVSRRDVTFVIDAITAGFDAGLEGLDRAALGARLAEATAAACEDASAPLSDADRALLEGWLVPADEAQDEPPGEGSAPDDRS